MTTLARAGQRDDHWNQHRDRAGGADEGRERCGDHHHRDHHRADAAAGAALEPAADGVGHTCAEEAAADDEQPGDHDDQRVRKPGQRLVNVDQPGSEQRQQRGHGHQVKPEAVADEQRKGHAEDGQQYKQIGRHCLEHGREIESPMCR